MHLGMDEYNGVWINNEEEVDTPSQHWANLVWSPHKTTATFHYNGPVWPDGLGFWKDALLHGASVEIISEWWEEQDNSGKVSDLRYR